MYKLMTSEKLLSLAKYDYLREELQHIRSTAGIDVLWIECNGSRFIPEYLRVEGRFIEVFVFQPGAERKTEHRKQYQEKSQLFDDCQGLLQGM